MMVILTLFVIMLRKERKERPTLHDTGKKKNNKRAFYVKKIAFFDENVSPTKNVVFFFNI